MALTPMSRYLFRPGSSLEDVSVTTGIILRAGVFRIASKTSIPSIRGVLISKRITSGFPAFLRLKSPFCYSYSIAFTPTVNTMTRFARLYSVTASIVNSTSFRLSSTKRIFFHSISWFPLHFLELKSKKLRLHQVEIQPRCDLRVSG
jgi:hypothetical protein